MIRKFPASKKEIHKKERRSNYKVGHPFGASFFGKFYYKVQDQIYFNLFRLTAK